MAETLEGLAAELEHGQATAVGLIERAFQRIEAFDSRLNSFVALDRSGALVAAKESDERRSRGRVHSRLDGIPISVKDNLHVAGFPTTWGSRALQDYRPAKDELPIARLRRAGMIVIGKTNAPEFTLEGYTRNDLFGVTRNPWNTDLTPGGSSGGAAASVAAGFVPAAIGTDGGGSIRRPACHTGLVGYKPSIGRWPRADGLPAILTDFETAGSLARTIEDTLLLDAMLRGPDPRDWRSSYAPAPSWPNKTARILYVPRFGAAPVDPEVASQVEAFARRLSSMGHDVREGEVFFDLEIAARVWHVVSRAGVAWLMAENPTYEKLAGATARAMAEDGRKVSGADYLGALEAVSAIRRLVAELFAGVDLVLTPTAAALPWPADKPYPDRIDGKPAGPRDHAIFTGWVNIAGVPAVSLPVGISRSGLPIGAHLAGAFGADDQLLVFAREVSRAIPPLPLPQLEAAL
ncbi:MAG: amidase [Hyphomicrobiales bacterium]|nr:amidase [Hyphomicrobiales bacterium]